MERNIEIMDLRTQYKRVDAARSEMELNRLKFLEKVAKLEEQMELSQQTLEKLDNQIKELEAQGE